MKTGLKKRVRCFYLLFIIITLITFASCSSGGSDQADSSFKVQGNGWLIVSGDTTPSVIDGTEFGPTPENGSETHTFTLSNDTVENISINSVKITGDASFSTDASALTLAPGDESDISIVFTPPEPTRNANATVTLEMNDDSYTFSLLGTTRLIWEDHGPWGSHEEDQEEWGRVYFDRDAVVKSNAAEQDLKEIAAGVWRDWNLMDLDSYSR